MILYFITNLRSRRFWSNLAFKAAVDDEREALPVDKIRFPRPLPDAFRPRSDSDETPLLPCLVLNIFIM